MDITLEEAINKLKILKFPPISFKEIRLLWHSDYYDGMLSGMLVYKSNKYWFSCFDQIDDYYDKAWDDDGFFSSEKFGWYRRFAIYEITDIEIEQEELIHKDFEEYVGSYTSYNDKNERINGETKETYKLFFELFFEKYKEIDVDRHEKLKSGKCIGWFYI